MYNRGREGLLVDVSLETDHIQDRRILKAQPGNGQAAVPVAENAPAGERVKIYELPGAQVACIVHQGNVETIGATYGQLMGWIETNGYRLVGPTREVHVQWQEGDPSSTIIECQQPVEKV